MNLSINIPNHINTLEVSELTKDELISELYDYYLAGVDLTQCTTDLPKSIIDLSKFNDALAKEAKITGITINQVEEDHVKEALEQCIKDEWDILNELINNHDEDFAAACLEYANGSDLSDAENKYIGQYDSDDDLAEELFMLGREDLPKDVLRYIDWESVTKDYLMDISEYNGYYFNA